VATALDGSPPATASTVGPSVAGQNTLSNDRGTPPSWTYRVRDRTVQQFVGENR